jgi:hypothetical protein
MSVHVIAVVLAVAVAAAGLRYGSAHTLIHDTYGRAHSSGGSDDGGAGAGGRRGGGSHHTSLHPR